MVYYIGSLRKIRFNRNILYCKCESLCTPTDLMMYLIGTFCIVNEEVPSEYQIYKFNLIETFCIVN